MSEPLLRKVLRRSVKIKSRSVGLTLVRRLVRARDVQTANASASFSMGSDESLRPIGMFATSGSFTAESIPPQRNLA